MHWSNHAFTYHDIGELQGSCRVTNPASRRVLASKSGFQYRDPGHDPLSRGGWLGAHRALHAGASCLEVIEKMGAGTMSMLPELKTRRLILRPIEMSDAEAMVALAGKDFEVARWMTSFTLAL